MNYRPETFTQFLLRWRPPAFFGWFLNIGYLGIIVFIFFQSYEPSSFGFWGLLIVVSLGFAGQKLFLYYSAFKIYHSGRIAFKKLGDHNVLLLKNIPVRVIGFDLYRQNKLFSPSTARTIYEFDQADIILSDQSMVLLGNTKSFGSRVYAAPVEITNGVKQTHLPIARLLGWHENTHELQIKIQDMHYSNPIIIRFRSEVAPIKNWLNKHKTYPHETQ